jgi:hypothetical protein
MVIPIYSQFLEHFLILQLIGFLFLVFGTLVFNEIIVVPFLGFDENTREAIERRRRTEEKLLQNGENTAANYSGLSPHASYDATRNMRNIENKKQENEGHDIG